MGSPATAPGASTPEDAEAKTPAHSDPLPEFFLAELEIENFRAIPSLTLSFQPGLNVLIGENNASKSAVIDALRILFSLGSFEKREDFVRPVSTDVCLIEDESPPNTNVTLTATFLGKAASDAEAKYYDILCVGDTDKELRAKYPGYLVFRLTYRVAYAYNSVKARHEVARSEIRGGATLDNPVSSETLDWMRAVYLAPLRDLTNDRGKVGAEIERLLLSHVAPKDAPELLGIPEKLRGEAARLIADATKRSHEEAASGSLSKFAKPYGIPDSALSFAPTGVSDRLFSTMIPVFSHLLHGPSEKLPLSSNGLGINQIIYSSIVLSRQGKANADSEVDRFFLIEEPEAHLHPQLQDSFFQALNGVTDHQIFVTSHSPSITAKTSLQRISVMRRSAHDGRASCLHLSDIFADLEQDRRYLEKFLDVTRSQLLFARGAVFVEGVTEGLLIQRFSEILGMSLRDHAIEVVVIDSAYGFEHFRPLFKGGGDAYARAVFITDGDENPETAPENSELLGGEFRFETGLRIAAEGSTAEAVGYGTFELGLILAAAAGQPNPGMQKILRDTFVDAAPADISTAERQDAFISDFLSFDNPRLSYLKMKEHSLRQRRLTDADWSSTWHTSDHFRQCKSEYAFNLNEALSKLSLADAKVQFRVPQYIKDAIEFVVEGVETAGETSK